MDGREAELGRNEGLAAGLRPGVVARIDVFNGDADGLCALQQLRLAEPADDARLVTGTKRDVALLARLLAGPRPAVPPQTRPSTAPALAIPSAPRITVLDISVDANRAALERLLEAGAEVTWFDHHYAGDLPTHPRLTLNIETGRDVCTSLLVDRHLSHRHLRWALVGAWGDNLGAPAEALANRFDVPRGDRPRLKALGESLNHNAYGDAESDLLAHPEALALAMRPFAEPLEFAVTPLAVQLDRGRREDLARASGLKPAASTPATEVYLLEDAPWARRVRGALGNGLVSRNPSLAYAIATPNAAGGWTISVRSPASAGNADAFCRQFESGGGRAASAGINHLPADRLDEFIGRFQQAFAKAPPG
jgi:hypothetical protein